MQVKTYIVDSFTSEPFKGNPAGVCLPSESLPGSLMQSIAAEINASETAFLVKHAANENTYHIRYFSPTVEMPFCGHATFASAKLMLELTGAGQVNFITTKGLELSGWRTDDGIKMHFPLFQLQPYSVNPSLIQAMGIQQYGAVGFVPEIKMLLIELPDKESLLRLSPDFAAMLKATPDLGEVVVTALSTDGKFDFYSRCFCPWIGIDEDPVTGASHSVMAAFWQKKTGRAQFKAYQCSRRGGYLDLHILGENLLQVVSDARIVLQGEMTV